jgi:hypothetical protein
MTVDIVAAGQSPGNKASNKGKSKKRLENKRKQKTSTELDKNRGLSFSTAYKMIHRFLTCDRIHKKEGRRLRYTKEELAEKLGISLDELERLNLPCFYKSVVKYSPLSRPIFN